MISALAPPVEKLLTVRAMPMPSAEVSVMVWPQFEHSLLEPPAFMPILKLSAGLPGKKNSSLYFLAGSSSKPSTSASMPTPFWFDLDRVAQPEGGLTLVPYLPFWLSIRTPKATYLASKNRPIPDTMVCFTPPVVVETTAVGLPAFNCVWRPASAVAWPSLTSQAMEPTPGTGWSEQSPHAGVAPAEDSGKQHRAFVICSKPSCDASYLEPMRYKPAT
mmetsp:Transcript_25966/g.74982  ORF Transcript_25966/g.74982 Transcript_25966/m.74982 type:complete len:218 (-) Transcript_25966:2851-3504(-)